MILINWHWRKKKASTEQNTYWNILCLPVAPKGYLRVEFYENLFLRSNISSTLVATCIGLFLVDLGRWLQNELRFLFKVFISYLLCFKFIYEILVICQIIKGSKKQLKQGQWSGDKIVKWPMAQIYGLSMFIHATVKEGSPS